MRDLLIPSADADGTDFIALRIKEIRRRKGSSLLFVILNAKPKPASGIAIFAVLKGASRSPLAASEIQPKARFGLSYENRKNRNA